MLREDEVSISKCLIRGKKTAREKEAKGRERGDGGDNSQLHHTERQCHDQNSPVSFQSDIPLAQPPLTYTPPLLPPNAVVRVAISAIVAITVVRVNAVVSNALGQQRGQHGESAQPEDDGQDVEREKGPEVVQAFAGFCRDEEVGCCYYCCGGLGWLLSLLRSLLWSFGWLLKGSRRRVKRDR